MITLKATNETIKINTGSAAGIDYSITYADLTTVSMIPGTSEGKITTATSTTIVAAPAASTQRQIKYISIRNIGGVTNDILVSKDIGGTSYAISNNVGLLAGEVYEYASDGRWYYYAANGALKAINGAAGNNTAIQYNASGALGGSDNFTYNPSNQALTTKGDSAAIVMAAVGGMPASPTVESSSISIFDWKISGKTYLSNRTALQAPSPFQNALFMNNIVTFLPGVAAGVWTGTITQNSGTAAAVLPTTTNPYTAMRRTTYATVVTNLNQQVGVRSENMFFRGSGVGGLGGFFFACRFGLQNWTSTNRLFVGLHSGTGAIVTVDPSTTTNMLGFGINTADTAITFMHNDGTGTAVKETIAGQPALATNNGYDVYIYCAPNDTAVYWRIDNSLTGVILAEGSLTTELPVNTTLMQACAIVSNGPTNTLVGAATIGVNKMYIETDR